MGRSSISVYEAELWFRKKVGLHTVGSVGIAACFFILARGSVRAGGMQYGTSPIWGGKVRRLENGIRTHRMVVPNAVQEFNGRA